jgi:hypothetical protein
VFGNDVGVFVEPPRVQVFVLKGVARIKIVFIGKVGGGCG